MSTKSFNIISFFYDGLNIRTLYSENFLSEFFVKPLIIQQASEKYAAHLGYKWNRNLANHPQLANTCYIKVYPTLLKYAEHLGVSLH